MDESLKSINQLTDDEKNIVKNILNEFASKGKSDELKNLYLEDYEEIPVDLMTFLCDDQYLGNYTNHGKDIYDTWKKELSYVHSPTTFCDQWAITGSTGTGKSTVGTYSICYELYKLMCLKNPNRFYLGADETIWILFFNLNLKLAERTMWGKFQKALQKSPWFMERGTVTGRTNLVYQPNKDIKLGIGSTEEHALSLAVFIAAIDEMSFGDNDNVDYMQAGMMSIYNQLYLRLSSRFSKGGKIQGRMYLISSAKSTNAVLESFIKDNEGQPGMHVSRYKQWEVLPASKFSGKWFKLAVGNELLSSYIMGVDPSQEEIDKAEEQGYTVIDCPLETLHRFEMDMNRTLIDTCGIAVQSSYKYIPYRIIEPCIGPSKNPFKDEILKIGLKDNYQIYDFFIPELVPEILYSKKVYVHCDLSKSGDMTGISAVAVLGYKNQERFDDTGATNTIKEMVFRQLFTVGLQCPANDELSMIKVKDFIHYLKYTLGWNIAGVSCDGYQSLMLLQSLKLDGFEVKEVSMDIVKNKEDIGYTSFRNVLVEQRIKIINLHTLIKELTSLEKNDATGKVDHPRQCLSGETTIQMLDGTTKTINELMIDCNNNIKNYVYTFNHNTNKIEPKLIEHIWQTGYRNDLYKITLDNDETIIATSDHPFMMRDSTYKTVAELKVGDSLMPLYTRIADKGSLTGYRLYYEPMENKWHYEHQQFDLNRKIKLCKNYVTHHANYNKLDNRPNNLKYISKSQHRYIHNRNQSDKERNKRSNSVKEWHKANKNTNKYKVRSQKTAESLRKYYLNHPDICLARKKPILSKESKLRMSRTHQMIITNGYERKFIDKNSTIPEGYTNISSVTKLNECKTKLNSHTKKLYKVAQLNINNKKLQLKQLQRRLAKINTSLNKQIDQYTKPVIKNTVRSKRPHKLKRSAQIKYLIKALNKVAYCKLANKQYNELSTQELYRGGTTFRNLKYPELRYVGSNSMHNFKWYTDGKSSIYTNNTDIPETFVPGRTIKNHKVKSIEPLNEYQKVYDIQVQDNHNFALGAGVFVHNSIKILEDRHKGKICTEKI